MAADLYTRAAEMLGDLRTATATILDRQLARQAANVIEALLLRLDALTEERDRLQRRLDGPSRRR